MILLYPKSQNYPKKTLAPVFFVNSYTSVHPSPQGEEFLEFAGPGGNTDCNQIIMDCRHFTQNLSKILFI